MVVLLAIGAALGFLYTKFIKGLLFKVLRGIETKFPSIAKIRAALSRPRTAPAHAFHRLEQRSLQSQGKISSLAADMKVNGWKGDPIAVFEHGGERYILDGHHRVAAARQARIEVPYRSIAEADLPSFNYRNVEEVLSAASEVFGL